MGLKKKILKTFFHNNKNSIVGQNKLYNLESYRTNLHRKLQTTLFIGLLFVVLIIQILSLSIFVSSQENSNNFPTTIESNHTYRYRIKIGYSMQGSNVTIYYGINMTQEIITGENYLKVSEMWRPNISDYTMRYVDNKDWSYLVNSTHPTPYNTSFYFATVLDDGPWQNNYPKHNSGWTLTSEEASILLGENSLGHNITIKPDSPAGTTLALNSNLEVETDVYIGTANFIFGCNT